MMEERADVVVVGSGIVGLMTARALSADGRDVLILDKVPSSGSGASGGNAGMLVPSHVIPLAAPGVIKQGLRWVFKSDSPFYIRPRIDWDLLRWIWAFRSYCSHEHVKAAAPVLSRMLIDSMSEYEAMAGSMEPFEFGHHGLLMVFHSEKGASSNAAAAEVARSVGVDVELLNQTKLLDLEPNVGSTATGAAYYSSDGHVDPGRLMDSLSRSLAAEGVQFRTKVEVSQVTSSVDGARLETASGKSLLAESVVLATGAWTPRLTSALGLWLPVQPGKGYSVTLRSAPGCPAIPLILSEDKVTVTPMGPLVRFAGTLELSGFDASIDRDRAGSIANVIPRYLPEVNPGDVRPEAFWSGYRPCTPDGLPAIGRVDGLGNVIVATGHGMLGVSLAPATARLVADLVAGRPRPEWAEAVAPDRF